jgi:triosephosphate isomerase (TIM)
MFCLLNTKQYLTKQDILHTIKKVGYSNTLLWAISPLVMHDVYRMFPNIKLVSQTHSPYRMGAYTGMVSIQDYQAVGVSMAMVGHSETRCRFTTTEIIQQCERAWEVNITPILCIGEHTTLSELIKQLKPLRAFSQQLLWIAYEPCWAIGNMIASYQHIRLACYVVADVLGKMPVILYGGQVSEDVTWLNKVPDVKGILVGGLTQYPDRLLKLLKNLKEI